MSAEPGGTSEGRVSRERIAEIRSCAKSYDEYLGVRHLRDLLAALDAREAALKACVEAMELLTDDQLYEHEYQDGEKRWLCTCSGCERSRKIKAALALARGFTEGK